MASTTSFPADLVPQAPEDPLFGLMRAYKADESPDKIDLVRGAPCFPCPNGRLVQRPHLTGVFFLLLLLMT